MTHRFKNVLVATDLSDGARALLGPAAMFARAHGASLNLVHADETRNVEAFSADGFGAIHRKIADAALRMLDEHLGELEKVGVKPQGHYVESSSREAIVEVSRKVGADLVVVGMSASSDRGVLVGSTTRWLLRHLEIPILAVPLNTQTPSAAAWKRIITTTDFSEDSSRGVVVAQELAKGLGAELNVVHILKMPRFSTFGAIDPADLPKESRKKLEELQRGQLAQVVEHVAPGVEHTIVSSPHVPEGLVRAATAWNADAIVIPSHGKGGVMATLLGSTSERLVEIGQTPVLVLPRSWLNAQIPVNPGPD